MLEKLHRAIAHPARAAIRAADTNALRIVDGPGDGFDDLAIDDFAGHWLVESRSAEPPAWLFGKAAENLEIRKSGKEGAASPALPDFLISRFNSFGIPLPVSLYWKRLGDKESPRWIAGERVGEPFEIRENGVRYWIDFASGYSQGIFLDQRDNRLALRHAAAGKTVLNTFAYTCAFGVSSAHASASETVNLDLSKRYLDWGRRNYELNGIPPARPHDFIHGDTLDWLRRFRKKGRLFDIVILDPPTFSRNEKGAVFTIGESFAPLVRAAAEVLAPGGMIFCSTNQRSLTPAAFRALILEGLDTTARWHLHPAPMPGDFPGEQYLKAMWVRGGEE